MKEKSGLMSFCWVLIALGFLLQACSSMNSSSTVPPQSHPSTQAPSEPNTQKSKANTGS
jgi:hypothetical protein